MLPIRMVLVLGLLMAITPFIWAQSASSTDFYGSAIDRKEICASSSGFMSEQDVERLIADMLAKQGLRNRFIVVECRSVANCLATVDKDRRPVILYNPDFLQRVKALHFTATDMPDISDRDWPNLTILAHEIGHHLNQHLTNPLPDATRRGMELEADQTAGYLLYLMGGRLEQGKLAFQTAPETGGYNYPPRAERLQALEKGFREGEKNFPRPVPVPKTAPVTPNPSPTNPYPVRPSSWEHAEAFSRDLVRVEGGTFIMGCTGEQGSECDDDEKPSGSVTISTFYLSRFEVTQRQWRWVMGDNPSNNQGCDDCPVEMVSWNSIQYFLEKLNEKTGGGYRLPTESEWEYAARGGRLSKGYKYAGGSVASSVGWMNANKTGKTHPVGKMSPNELGLYDMSGSVSEWCQDWYGKYSNSVSTDPTGPVSGTSRILRGGGWNDNSKVVRVSSRIYLPPMIGHTASGFRLAYQAR